MRIKILLNNHVGYILYNTDAEPAQITEPH